MKLFANIISILFHPLLMVTYGVGLAITFTYLAIYPPGIKLFLLGGVFISTALVPGLLVYLIVKSGGASDLELTNRKERLIPYMIFITSYLICLFFMYRMRVPYWMNDMIIAVCVALIIAFLINFFWKISAHAIGIGGLLGAVMGISQIHLMNPYPTFIALIICTGLVGSSRVILNKHTPMQVYAGSLLGFSCTFLFAMKMYLYFLLIK